jgi:hypothetical protein
VTELQRDFISDVSKNGAVSRENNSKYEVIYIYVQGSSMHGWLAVYVLTTVIFLPAGVPGVSLIHTM